MNLKTIFAATLLCAICTNINGQRILSQTNNKLEQTIQYIERFYVEKANMDKIMDKGIVGVLQELDPHSVYIPAKEVEKINEPLKGNFMGVGIAFKIFKDTINVMEIIKGGPAEKVGMLPGDKIISIDGQKAYGSDSITNNWVLKKLRGKKGTKVKIKVIRKNIDDFIEFEVRRDKIPINSVGTYFMVDKSIGYISLQRFSQSSAEEVRNAIKDLKKQGMKSLIFDLRGNGGGFLEIAGDICDEFLSDNKLIVYTEGLTVGRQILKSTRKGEFETGRLVILIDESSASASEIVSGAVQDHDRGIIIGRRSFGKGLVQRMFPLADGGQLRLTTSRYYTPSGRCIQKPYNDGLEAYYNELMNRYNQNELIDPDKIDLPDSVKYYTANKRVVYGGGGIIPDIFVPIDTTRISDYYIEIRSKGLINNFALEYANQNRNMLLEKYPTYEEFDKNYRKLNITEEFKNYAAKNGIKENKLRPYWIVDWAAKALNAEIKDTTYNVDGNSYAEITKKMLENPKFIENVIEKAKEEDKKIKEITKKSEIYINGQIKAAIAGNLYGTNYYYEAIKEIDEGYKTALEVIKSGRLFRRLNIED